MGKKPRIILIAGTFIAIPVACAAGALWDFSKVLAAALGVLALSIDLGSVIWADAIEDG